ncbi:putative toxin-antitoxin system toxin component, PIN family [Candidatus Woesearchaeota archaeon]|nr:putative toxin-antitoxin system toxin component, PIN family [Candidatus Woesearchaeota archaeon]
MGKKRIVLDTNILISALGWNGKPRELFLKALNKEFELIISKGQIDELKRVLEYSKFGFTDEQKLKFLNILLEVAVLVEVPGKLKIIKEDPPDDNILETAVEGGADFIISGDWHILKLKQFNDIKIVKVSEFFKIIA